MNLAIRDIRFNRLRFGLTALGVAFLILAAIGMIGLYRGIVADALQVIDGIGADLWVVQGGRAGPFAEASAIRPQADRRVEGLEGVARVRRFVQSNQTFVHRGRSLRATVTGLDYPRDHGEWLPVDVGRLLRQGHFEAVVDRSVGLSLGDEVVLAHDRYRVVGLTQGMVDSMGDGLLFVSTNDAITIARRRTSEEVLLARAGSGIAPSGDLYASSVPQDSKVAAILVDLLPGADVAAIREAIGRWGDLQVLSRQEQRDLLLDQRLWRLRVQILAFTGVLLGVMVIVISLIIYTMTLEKLHPIAMLKLIGAPNRVIVGMILQQAALIGLFAYVLGIAGAWLVFPHFPRRVLLTAGDLGALALAVAVICGLATVLGIRRALQVRAQEVLS